MTATTRDLQETTWLCDLCLRQVVGQHSVNFPQRPDGWHYGSYGFKDLCGECYPALDALITNRRQAEKA